MADVITSIATFEGVNEELFQKPFYEDPAVSDLGLKVVVGVNPRLAYFNTNLDKKTIEKTACAPTYQTGIAITKKTITPVEFELSIEQCYRDFVGTLYGDKLPAGVAKGELTPEITDFLLGIHNSTFRNDMVRKMFLSDTGDADTFYSSFDGVYSKLTGSTYDAGALVAGDFALNAIEETMYDIYNTQSDLLRAVPDAQKKLWVTGNVFDAWKRYLQANVASFNVTAVQSGIADTQVTYNGIPLVPLRFVDRALAADFLDSSGNVVDPYRVILTAPNLNHQLVMDKASFGDAKAWYSADDNMYRISGTAFFAYEFGYDELNVVAGF